MPRSNTKIYQKVPLWTLSLIKLTNNQHILLIGLPALCTDAASLRSLAHELSEAYEYCLMGGETLPEAIQYADVAEWQNELLETEDTALGRDYWQQQDFSALASLKLPFAVTSNQASTGFQPRSFRLAIQSDLLSSIQDAVNQDNTSVESFLLTCWFCSARSTHGPNRNSDR